MSVIRCMVVDAGVQALVIIVIKILGYAALRVGQVSKNGPLAHFEHFGFGARPQAFGLGIIVSVAAVTLRAHGFMVVQQLTVGVAAVLPAPVGGRASQAWVAETKSAFSGAGH